MKAKSRPKIKKHDYLFWPIVMILPKSVTPNHVSGLRIILVLPLILLIIMHFFKPAGIFYLFISILDALDGSMARLRNQETKLGKIIDPTADKIVNSAAFITLPFCISIVTALYVGAIGTLITVEFALFCVAAFKYVVRDIAPHLPHNHWLFAWLEPELISSIEIKSTGANKWGKTKMVTEVVVLFCLLFFNPETSFKIHEKYGFLPDHLTLLHLSFPLLIACIVFALLSLKGHLQVIKINSNVD